MAAPKGTPNNAELQAPGSRETAPVLKKTPATGPGSCASGGGAFQAPSGTWKRSRPSITCYGQPSANFVVKQPKSARLRMPSPLQSAYAMPSANWVVKQPKSDRLSSPSPLQSG